MELHGLLGFDVIYYTYQHVPYLVAVVDCIHVGSATASFKDLVTLHWRNPPTNMLVYSLPDRSLKMNFKDFFSFRFSTFFCGYLVFGLPVYNLRGKFKASQESFWS